MGAEKEINKEIYTCIDKLSNSVGEIITEYHWREFCGLMKMMEDNGLVEVEPPIIEQADFENNGCEWD